MSDPTIKPADQLRASAAQLCALPIFAFLLGRQSMTFTGSWNDWFILAGNVIGLAAGLFETAKGFRTVP